MFDGVPEQFHQFITSRASLPIPLSTFPLNGSSSPAAPPPIFPSFEPYPSHQTVFQHHLHLHHQLPTTKDDKKGDQNSRNILLESNLVLGQGERSIADTSDLWSEDEVLTLLRIRSSMESWFPEFTWEHVSRKLAELGFKRSAEKCREKFEEESRSFNSLSYNKNFRIYTELDEIYQGENAHVKAVDEKIQDLGKQNEEVEREREREGEAQVETEEDKGDEANNKTSMENDEQNQQEKISKKRKRKYKFKKIELFCETVVNEIKVQQEKLHNKLIEEILKRDEELIAKEEAWKTQELEKLNKEMENIRAKQQAIAADRQTMLLEFLNKFTSDNGSSHKDPDFSKKIEDLLKIINNPSTSSVLQYPGDTTLVQNPNFPSIPTQKITKIPTSSSDTQSPQNPSSIFQPTNVPNEDSSSTQSMSTQNPNFDKMIGNSKELANSTQTSSYKAPSKGNDDTGKRWPKDEVLALINLRCSFNNMSNNCDDNNKESGGGKCPLWERISQGMEKLGYKRSAKRCKEKWENINKYFRKTKDNNKKRSLDSRTCPYFHQLSRLYSQGILVAPTAENSQTLPENSHQTLPENSHTVLENISSEVGNGKEELHATVQTI